MNLVMALSDHIAVLHRGRLLFEGTPEAVRENPDGAGGLSWQPRRASDHPRRCSPSNRSRPATGGPRYCTALAPRSLPARSSPSSGRTAPARRRCSTPSPASATSAAATIRFKGEDIAGLRPDKVRRPRHQPLPGGAPHLPAAHRRGESDRQPIVAGRQRAVSPSCSTRSSGCSRCSASGARAGQPASAAASSRCWRSPAP